MIGVALELYDIRTDKNLRIERNAERRISSGSEYLVKYIVVCGDN